MYRQCQMPYSSSTYLSFKSSQLGVDRAAFPRAPAQYKYYRLLTSPSKMFCLNVSICPRNFWRVAFDFLLLVVDMSSSLPSSWTIHQGHQLFIFRSRIQNMNYVLAQKVYPQTIIINAPWPSSSVLLLNLVLKFVYHGDVFSAGSLCLCVLPFTLSRLIVCEPISQIVYWKASKTKTLPQHSTTNKHPWPDTSMCFIH